MSIFAPSRKFYAAFRALRAAGPKRAAADANRILLTILVRNLRKNLLFQSE